MDAPAAELERARRLARYGTSVTVLLRAFRLGQGVTAFQEERDRRPQWRLSLVNEAGPRIETTLDIPRTIQELAALALDHFADLVTVDLLDSAVHEHGVPAPGPLVVHRVARAPPAHGWPRLARGRRPSAVARARSSVTRQLAAWELEDLGFITELVVGELVTNAICYGRPPSACTSSAIAPLLCEVSDAGSTTPHLRRARAFDEGGHGLLLVAQLAERWGTRHARQGKTVWAELGEEKHAALSGQPTVP
ncbi:ATP-binding protein [Streptomyces scabiei]|uniref:ATP-binding protein n=1 Tax=Streptomyces scabiei TaxID=1930 RepID=UPI0039F70A40